MKGIAPRATAVYAVLPGPQKWRIGHEKKTTHSFARWNSEELSESGKESLSGCGDVASTYTRVCTCHRELQRVHVRLRTL